MTSIPRRQPPVLELVHDARHAPEHACKAKSQAEREHEWSMLMARAQAGDAEAYERLLKAITPLLRACAARRHREPGDIEDAVQDILLTLHAARHTYDPARPFGPWLNGIARHRLVDRLRRHGRTRAREVALDAEDECLLADHANPPDEAPDRQALSAAVARLPATQQRAIRLLKIEQMSLKEAAAETGTSVTALKVATHRALANLRKMLA